MRGKRIAKIVIALAIVGIAYSAFKDDIAKLWQDLHVKIVEHPTPKKTVWLDQGIAKDKLSWFYHADQGTRTFGFPYEWFMALEQPTISWLPFTKVGRLQRHRLSRPLWLHPGYHHPRQGGASDRVRERRPDAGSLGRAMANPRTKETMIGVGLTCAACHTGSFTYKDTAVVIDGGPALTNLFAMKQGMGISLLADALLARPVRPLRRAHPGTGRHARRPRNAEEPAQPGSQSVQRGQEPGRARRLAEHPGRLRTAGRPQPDRQPGVFNRPEEAGKLRRLLRAGALPPDLEHAVVRLGAV